MISELMIFNVLYILQPNQPFVIINDKTRQEIKSGVFKPHWNLPTMSIDQYLANEEARGNILSGGGK